MSLVASYAYLTDETYELVEGNPLQATLLRQKGIRTDNLTSSLGMKAKTVRWEIWLRQNNNKLINAPIPVESQNGEFVIPDAPLSLAVDQRPRQQIYDEHSDTTDTGLEFVDMVNLFQDTRNAFKSKWDYLIKDAKQKYRASDVSIEFLGETSKYLSLMKRAPIGLESIPLFPGDMTIFLETSIKKTNRATSLRNVDKV